jgi:3',5'-cyclic-nucleotide phosphodiesterase
VKKSVPFSVKLSVDEGPDANRTFTCRFENSVSIGRSKSNDITLGDRYVSKEHAELTVSDDAVVLRDLDSRHGSRLFMPDGPSHHLEGSSREVPLSKAEQLSFELGTSRLEIDDFEIEETSPVDPEKRPNSRQEQARSEILTTRHRPRETIVDSEQIPDDSHQLEVLFQLAGELNGLSRLDEILERIAKAAFKAFSGVNFFAVTLLDKPEDVENLNELEPYFTKSKEGDHIPPSEGPLLSRELVGQAMDKQENILFIKDQLGPDATESIISAQIEASLCSPLVGQEKLLGAMQVDARHKGGLLTRDDLNIFSLLASHAAFAIERAELTENIREIFEQFVEASVGAIETRDANTAGHSRRVADYADQLARCVARKQEGRFADRDFSEQQLQELEYAALLHDFGKIAVPERVLNKANRLEEDRLKVIEQRFKKIKMLKYKRLHQQSDSNDATDKFEAMAQQLDDQLAFIKQVNEADYVDDDKKDQLDEIAANTYVGEDGKEKNLLTDRELKNLKIETGTLNDNEWEQMQAHPSHSRSFLEQIPWGERFEEVPFIAGTHHEKLDGSGYPYALDADEIPFQTRILTVVDTYDALTSTNRAYRDAYSSEKAIRILRAEVEENRLDEDLVDLFVEEVLP